MTHDTRNSVGVDISKAHLDAYMSPSGKAARFSNDAAGFKALIAWIGLPVRTVIYEPTGQFHRAFEEALLKAELPLVRVNPWQARRFAEAIGQRAKTDAVDARVLAQMGAAVDLRPTEASSPARRALEELQVAREALVRDRTGALNRQRHLRHRLLKRQNTTRLSQIDRHLAAIDAEISKRLADDEVLARRTEILVSIPGVSRVTAAGLLSLMPELGHVRTSRQRPSAVRYSRRPFLPGSCLGVSFMLACSGGRSHARPVAIPCDSTGRTGSRRFGGGTRAPPSAAPKSGSCRSAWSTSAMVAGRNPFPLSTSMRTTPVTGVARTRQRIVIGLPRWSS